MAYTWADNVHTTAFTPRDYQVELLAAAFEENVFVCIEQNSSKEFIALKLIHELGSDLRRQDHPKATVYLAHERNGTSTYNLMYHLTDLVPLNCCDPEAEEVSLERENLLRKVVIISPERLLSLLEADVLRMDHINLLVVENCHKLSFTTEILGIFTRFYERATCKPKILGLAGPFHNAGCPLGRLGAEIECLEQFVHCRAETASDIVTLLRYCTKPNEVVVQCAPLACDEITLLLAHLVQSKIDYLKDHRFDPMEIYSDEYYDELKNIPDPKAEPLTFLEDFLQVLKEFGPWCADKAALALLIQIEKSKVKTPYERHFLLLCMTSTTFVHVRAFCDSYFCQLSTERERISCYSSPKVLRLLSILGCFKPDPKGKPGEPQSVVENSESLGKNGNFRSAQLITEIDSLDFKGLSLSSEQIEEHVNGLSEVQESGKLKDTLRNITEKTLDVLPNNTNSPMRSEGRAPRTRRKNLMSHSRQNRAGNNQSMDPDALCGLLFCDTEFTAKVLFSLLYEVSKSDGELNYLSVQYIVDKVADPLKEVKQAESEHRKQEEVLKRFRMHECNLLIGTSILEKEIDLPKCNLVIRWNAPKTYRSYVQCKGRARALNAHHVIMVGADVKPLEEPNGQIQGKTSSVQLGQITNSDHSENCGDDEEDKKPPNEENLVEMRSNTAKIVKQFAEYVEMEKMLLGSCANNEPEQSEISLSERFSQCIVAYKPLPAFDAASVNLSTAVALVNKYCAKLPSDTFTKLTPIWRYEKAYRKGTPLYKCSLRLPINSPLKCDINGYLMPSRTLARRLTALIACRLLHMCGELDDNLLPIGKEGYRAFEPDWENFELESTDEMLINDNLEPRPGTTKRRQYYYKRVASALSGCRPTVGEECYFYYIQMVLKCPIPEEQNTRGRKIYPPEESMQGFGLLTVKKIPQISAFPIFTRSGEVEVSLRLIAGDIVLSDEKLQHINTFINYTFTNVLRLQKYLMLFDADANENCYFVVPTVRDGESVAVDWDFLRLISDNADVLPQAVAEEERATQAFDANKFKDAVVMPWYRNQDQPQYFYVAEICFHLSPESSFPGENYSTFREYYFRKYSIQVQNIKQPLLDVDHTSARLNFLTPRYVNRKGVALPTSSEETKRAKRENLEQKQILVPELCTIHPFSASLWRAAVCLPCILYRFNALLLADEIRRQVSQDLGLGRVVNGEDFEWPSLDFGWSLAEVLRKSREAAKKECLDKSGEDPGEEKSPQDDKPKKTKLSKKLNGVTEKEVEIDEDDESNEYDDDVLEIGTWSNDMANDVQISFDGLTDDHWMQNPNQIRYGSPTSWNAPSQSGVFDPTFYDTDTDDSLQSEQDDTESVKSEGKMRIEFKSDNLAEAIETEEEILKRQKKLAIINDMILGGKCTDSGENDFNNLQSLPEISLSCSIEECERRFEESVVENIERIGKSGMLVKHDEEVIIVKKRDLAKELTPTLSVGLLKEFLPYAEEEDFLRFYQKGGITLEDLQSLNTAFVAQNGSDEMKALCSGHLFDRFITTSSLSEDAFIEQRRKKLQQNLYLTVEQMTKNYNIATSEKPEFFSFDYQPNLKGHPGPSPSIILQALTMSNANDGINLERLETIGDSFLKYAITTYLYCTYEDVHEGKLSHLRSKQVSNLNLYRLGRRKMLGESMISTKFEPHDNWLPPCYYIPKELEKALIEARIPACHWNLADLPNLKEMTSQEICSLIRDRATALGLIEKEERDDETDTSLNFDNFPCFIPYNLVTQHSIPDKSVADCVEALIGAYLIECGPRGALLFMAWVGIRVLPCFEISYPEVLDRLPGTSILQQESNTSKRTVYGWWTPPKSPLLSHYPEPEKMLAELLDGFDQFEKIIEYEFRDKSYLLQAMTHASYSPNRLTDCYQRLEFLGDAVLDYLITRHLYEDPRQHSPGALTDLRSALVNNTIFASLAVRHGFHKYFRHLSPGLNEVIDRFVRFQHENGHSISEEYYLISEDECDEAEDVEVPKALGDVFESVAGAIFLDSGMSLDAVWKVYSNMMRPEIEQFSNSVPKSPIRELLELEPETAKFSKPEKLADGRRVRVMVEVFGKGTFRGIGRNYRIAKCTAAKCALRQLKKQGLIGKKH